MWGIIYTDHGVWVFLLMTLVLGGAAGVATGRALAKTWRPYWQILLYMIPLAGAVQFLHYALFGEPFLALQYYDSLRQRGVRDPVRLFGEAVLSLRYLLVTYMVVAASASIGFRRMRGLQMITQYRFAFEPAGPLGWRAKPGRR